MNAGAADRHDSGHEDAGRDRVGSIELMSHFGHALRTPLNSILGFAQILALDSSEPLSSVQKERVERIQAGGWQLLQLIDDLVDLCRLETGRLEIPLEPVALEAVIRESLARLATEAAERRIALQADPGPDATVQADPARLKYALVNLLTGALLCARPDGALRVGVRTLADWIEIRIADPAQTLPIEHLRETFAPLDQPARARSSGAGAQIGMALAQKLLEQMGGHLRIERGAVAGCELQVLLRPA